MTPRAPAARALSIYRLPSVLPPFIATKTEPGLTRRESYSTALIGSAESPAEPAAVISVMRARQSMSELNCSWIGAFCTRKEVSGQSEQRFWFLWAPVYPEPGLVHARSRCPQSGYRVQQHLLPQSLCASASR